MEKKEPFAPFTANRTQENTVRIAEAETLVRYHAAGAAALSLVPIPFLDLVLLSAAQLNMLRSLAKKYEVSFSEQAGKAVIAALVGTGLPIASASLLKLLPAVGSAMGMLAFGATAGASTYAIGRVFIQHLESGGTFLTLDPEKVRSYYKEQYAQGQRIPFNQEERPKP